MNTIKLLMSTVLLYVWHQQCSSENSLLMYGGKIWLFRLKKSPAHAKFTVEPWGVGRPKRTRLKMQCCRLHFLIWAGSGKESVFITGAPVLFRLIKYRIRPRSLPSGGYLWPHSARFLTPGRFHGAAVLQKKWKRDVTAWCQWLFAISNF